MNIKAKPSKLTQKQREAEMSELTDDLKQAVGRSECRLTEADIDQCWQEAKFHWHFLGRTSEGGAE